MNKTWKKPLSSWKQGTLPSFLITYYKAELPACHFTHKWLIRVLENGHESEHEFGHWHYLLKPEINHLGRGKGVREDPHTPKAKNHPQPAHAALPTRRYFTEEFRLWDFCKPESPASVPHLSYLFSAIFPLLKTEHITQLQLTEDFAACLSQPREIHHFLQKISSVLVALKIIAQKQIQFLTLIYIS